MLILKALSTIITFGLVTHQAQATVFHAYSGFGCEGDVQENINVWDNTCADWMGDFSSVRAVAPGGWAQRLSFITQDCLSGKIVAQYWADFGGDYWKEGVCITLEEKCSAASSFLG